MSPWFWLLVSVKMAREAIESVVGFTGSYSGSILPFLMTKMRRMGGFE